LLCALLWEDVWAHDLRVGVFFVPGAEEDVVLLRRLLAVVLVVLVGLQDLPLHLGRQCTLLRPAQIPFA
jgi:hypothetical protein